MRYDVPTLSESTNGMPREPRLTLRAHREEDMIGVFEQATDPVSQAWTTVPVPYTRDHAKRFVRESMPGGWQTDVEWGFAVDVDGRYAGTISLRNEREGRAEIAFGSHPWVRGTGLMERALRVLLAWGFEHRELQMVIWWANRGNYASRKLAWRLGFDVEGTVRSWLPQRGELLDAWVGTLLSTDDRLPRHRWLEPPVVESPRRPLRLRPTREADVARMVEGCSDPETARWLGFLRHPYPRAEAEAMLGRQQDGMASGRALHLAVAATDDDRLLGQISLVDVDEHLRSAEIGYWTHPAERGRGVMTEAVRLATRHALLPEDVGGLGLLKVLAHSALDNPASRAVLGGAGLTEAGVERLSTRTRDGLRDAARYELLSDELRS
ncbi:MAG: GNAT family N-acetyltransferase [Actinomycetota bacterium]|nr:GNAT family N-acetyltransferase [Actinomycetota bacterium]